MKSVKKSFLTIIIFFFAIILVYGLTTGQLYYLFLFPLLALSFFLFFYLYRQNQTDDEKRLEKSAKFAVEDKEAEQWIQKSLAPDTLRLIKTKRWAVIMYAAILFLGVFFLWNYLSNGLSIAIRNLSYAGALLGVFILYILIMPKIFQILHSLLPVKIKRFINGDWERGYIFLLPITFIIYILYPFSNITEHLLTKIFSFPIFFFVYSAFFLCAYSIVFMYQDIHKEDEKQLKKEVKEMIEK